MLRFYDTDFKEDENIWIHGESLIFEDEMWEKCRNLVRKYGYFRDKRINIMSINDKKGNLVSYGYQDKEANRELRMLKELIQCKEALQFNDIFPEYKEVIICGCNELAVRFAKYLEMLAIKVSVLGKYWECFGYANCHSENLNGEGKLVIFAEGVISHNSDLIQETRKSVSPEFECIDKIYEANVLNRKIHDTIGEIDDLICRLEREKEIVLLGDGREAQDAYDLLMGHGIDICGFAVEVNTRKRLLGKKVMSIDEAVKHLHAPIFVECHGKNGALGEEYTEYFDYCGYERNRNFFLLRDYTDIPVSNLIHVLHGKNVILTGDKRLCQLLSKYLYNVENGNIFIECIDLNYKVVTEENSIVCVVFPDYYNHQRSLRKKRNLKYNEFLSNIETDNYTDYFIRSRSFSIIDEYLNRDNEKYTVPKLTPKGILLGKIPPWSGNTFFKGIMDGHPEILVIPYSDLNENIFWYCVRLAGCDSDEIISDFWEMYDAEACAREIYFPDAECFEISLRKLLVLKKSFTSQELFMIFHIAYAEMLCGKELTSIQNLVIYWEPHFVPRYDFPFLAQWLEDRKINGQTIGLRRNNVVRTGSACARTIEDAGKSALLPFYTMFLDESVWNTDESIGQYWKHFKMRFEEIKLNPKKMLGEVCGRMDITWSDNMLKTTSNGQTMSYRGSTDFELKAVFNKYDDFLSEFDRFRISIASSPYQKRYGYSYESCLIFSRREVQEMFLKPFLFERNETFKIDIKTHMKICEWIKWQLWEVRKHMVLDDICIEFDRIEIK